MYFFPNYYLLNYNFRNFSILKHNSMYYLFFSSLDTSKFIILPIGYYLNFLRDGICIFFNGDMNLYKNYLYYFKHMLYA